MYEVNNRNFAFKDLIIKILFIIIFIFIIIWLFPTKGYIDKKLGTKETQIFNNNLIIMKDAALSYYNGSRLPDKKEKITLKQMIDKNLLPELTTNNNKICDTKKSYVEINKNNDEYKLKVNLTCNGKEKYIVSYIGNYEYCTSDVCEKKKLNENESKTEETKIESTQANECEYVKQIGGYWTKYSNWSNWTTAKLQNSNNRQIETKKEQIQVGTKTVQTGTQIQKQNPLKLTYSNGSVIYECKSEFDNAGRYTKPTYCIKTIPKYETKPVYKEITYYRHRDRKYINATKDYIWSNCNNTELLNQGYTKTGKTK